METYIISLIGGMGLGTIFTNIINSWLKKKENFEKRSYIEKKKNYLGLLNSIYFVNINNHSKESLAEFALWEFKIKLFGSPDVIKYVSFIKKTKSDSKENNLAYDNLLLSMRNDLNIDKRELYSIDY